MGDLGWPIDKGQLKFIVSPFIQEMDIKSSFKENMPGDERLIYFKTTGSIACYKESQNM